MIPNATVGSEQALSQAIPCIGEVVFSFGNVKIMSQGMTQDTRIMGGPFPSGQDISKLEIERANPQYVL
jgi:hypothetical protein